jgi:hypothetical protein
MNSRLFGEVGQRRRLVQEMHHFQLSGPIFERKVACQNVDRLKFARLSVFAVRFPAVSNLFVAHQCYPRVGRLSLFGPKQT